MKNHTKLNSYNHTKLKYFSEFVNSRKEYLESLHNIPDNWISGESLKPNEFAIGTSKDILDTLYLFINEHYDQHPIIPKIVMSPIPIGGIGFEILLDNDNSLMISIYNNENFEIELQVEGEFSGYKLSTEESIKESVTKAYSELVSKYGLEV